MRKKNALRKHYVQEYIEGEEYTDNWLRLAKYINTMGDDTQETTEEEGFYDGDGTPELDVVSVAGAYAPEGYYDPEDPAQAFIAGLKYATGSDRKIWHRIVSSDEETEWIGRATVSSIVDGAGDATAWESFSCNIRFDTIPEQTDATGGGTPGG